MKTSRTRNRLALEAASLFAAALLIASAASAQEDATPTVASDMCDYASEKPDELQTELIDRFQTLGFTGLPPEQCGKFTQSLVKHCLMVVRAATQCSVNANATVGRMSTLDCGAEPSKESQKSCKQDVQEELTDEQATASQTVQLLGARVCNGSFAVMMDEICREGVTPP